MLALGLGGMAGVLEESPAVVGLSFLGEFFSHVLRGEVSVKYNPLHCNTFYTKTKEMRG